MNPLAKIFASTVRAEIFRLLFGHGDVELHMREIERQTGLAIGTIQQDLKHLSELELVKSRRDGNRLYYQANKDHPLYPEIHSLVIKTIGLMPLLERALAATDTQCAFIFGSIARNEATADSDVDLMVIGHLGLRKLTALLSEPAKEVGREMNPHVFTPEEFSKRVRSKDHFINRVLEDRKIFILGDADVLARLGK